MKNSENKPDTTPGKKSNALTPNLETGPLSAVRPKRDVYADDEEEYTPRSVPAPAPDRFDRSAMPKIRRRRTQKFLDLYDPLSTYIDKAYVEAFELIIEKHGPNKTAIVNEAIYEMLKKHKETLLIYGIDVERLPIPRY